MKAPSVHRPDGSTVYPVRATDGELVAYHVRIPLPGGGKRFEWRLPDGRRSSGEVKTASLPLYGSELWGEQTRLVVVEGEKACDALIELGCPAVATTGGAGVTPSPDALRELAVGRTFVLWSDNDDAGRAHMANVAQALTEAGAEAVSMVRYEPSQPIAQWPEQGDADDFIRAVPAGHSAAWWVWQLLDTFSQPWAVPAPRSAPRAARMTVVGGSASFGSVSDALHDRYGITTAPGRNVRCPMHPDRHASLRVLPDDQRAYCHSPTCAWSGRGVIAGDIRNELRAVG